MRSSDYSQRFAAYIGLAVLGARRDVPEVASAGDCVGVAASVASSELFEVAGRKLRAGANLTRPEAAAFLGVSTKRLQRMEISGALSRCPGLGTSVLYSSRDVLLLASASRRKGA